MDTSRKLTHQDKLDRLKWLMIEQWDYDPEAGIMGSFLEDLLIWGTDGLMAKTGIHIHIHEGKKITRFIVTLRPNDRYSQPSATPNDSDVGW